MDRKGFYAQYIKKLELLGLTLRNEGIFTEISWNKKMISEVKITPVLDFCVQKHFILSCLTIYIKIRTPLALDGLKTFALYLKIGNYFPFFSFSILHNVRSPPLNLKMSAVWRHRHFSSTNSESEGFNLKHDGCKSAFRQMASASRTP